MRAKSFAVAFYVWRRAVARDAVREGGSRARSVRPKTGRVFGAGA